MGKEEILAKRYACGLAECAVDASKLDEVREDVKTLAEVLDPHSGRNHVPEFLDLLQSPMLPPAEKRAAAQKVLTALGIGEIAGDFLFVLVEHGRIQLLPHIVKCFAGIAGAMTGELTAMVHSARDLTPEQELRLSEALSAAFGVRVRIHQQVVPGLLAGIRVTVGDKTFDGTVLGRLEELKHRLMAGGNRGFATLDAAADAAEG